MDITKLKSVKDVPKEEIFFTDGKTVVTNDGTKVSDELIMKAKDQQAKAKAAAVTALPDMVSRDEVQAMLDAALANAGKK